MLRRKLLAMTRPFVPFAMTSAFHGIAMTVTFHGIAMTRAFHGIAVTKRSSSRAKRGDPFIPLRNGGGGVFLLYWLKDHAARSFFVMVMLAVVVALCIRIVPELSFKKKFYGFIR